MPLVLPKEGATQEEINAWIVDTQEKYNKMEIDLNNKTKREKELEEHNQKLFLKITTPQETKEEKKDKEEQEYIDFVGEDFYNSLSNKEKEKLKIILEGEDE